MATKTAFAVAEKGKKMRLIDADALRAREGKVMYMGRNANKTKTLVMWVVNELIKTAPTIDAVPVVRCKDCLYFHALDGCPIAKSGYFKNGKPIPHDNDFCSYGERQINDGEI